MSMTILIALGILQQTDALKAFSSSGHFDPVPDEVVESIFTYLPPLDLISVLPLNRRLNNVIKNSTMLQYSSALQLYGFVDGNKADLMEDKLLELLRREEGWRTAALSRRISIPGNDHLSRVYGVSNGVVYGDNDDDDGLSTALKTLHISAFGQASSSNRKDLFRIVPKPGAGHILDVTIVEGENDLVTIITGPENSTGDVVVHLRQKSTGLPHPLADNPEIHTGVLLTDDSLDDSYIKAEVIGSYLVILLSESVYEKDVLLLVDWWKGEIIKREEWPSRTYGAFAFLTHDLLLFPNLSTRQFEIVKLPDHTEQSDTDGETFRRIAYLHVSGNKRKSLFSNSDRLSCFSAPNPAGARQPVKPNVAPSHLPFVADSNQAIIVVQAARDGDLVLIIHRKALVATLDAHVAQHPMSRKGLHLPWKEWTIGPDGGTIRWICYEDGCEWTTYGQRLIGIQAEQCLRIKDFNPYAVRRARASLKAAAVQDANSDMPQLSFAGTCHPSHNGTSLWLNDCTYKQVVESGVSLSRIIEIGGELPYVETVTELDDDAYTNVLVDGERLVCIQAWWDHRFQGLDIYFL